MKGSSRAWWLCASVMLVNAGLAQTSSSPEVIAGEKVTGVVSGGNLPPDLRVILVDAYDHKVGTGDVLQDGSFTVRTGKVDYGGRAKDVKAIFIRKNGETFAEVKIND